MMARVWVLLVLATVCAAWAETPESARGDEAWEESSAAADGRNPTALDYVAFVEGSGYWPQSLRLQVDAEDMIHVYATRDIKADEVVLSQPKESLITPESAGRVLAARGLEEMFRCPEKAEEDESSDEGGNEDGDAEREPVEADAGSSHESEDSFCVPLPTLTMVLFHALMSRDENSQYAPYYRHLPKVPKGINHWTPEEMELLNGTRFILHRERAAYGIRKFYWSKLAVFNSVGIDGEEGEIEVLRWARLLSTRVPTSILRHSAPYGGELFHHSDSGALASIGENGELVFTAQVDIKQGQEVFVSYCDRSEHGGFSALIYDLEPIITSVHIRPLDYVGVLQPFQVAVVPSELLETSVDLHLDMDVSELLIPLLRLLTLTFADVERHSDPTNARTIINEVGGVINGDNELAALRFGVAMIQTALDHYVEEFPEELGRRANIARNIVEAEKSILVAVAKKLRQHWRMLLTNKPKEKQPKDS